MGERSSLRAVSRGTLLAELVAVRTMLATLLVAGCSFEHGRLPGGQAVDDPDDPLGLDAATSITRVCKEKDASVRLCIELEDRVYDPIHDASVYQMDADPSGVIAYDRAGTPAAATAGGEIKVAETQYLDIADEITMEMWIRIPLNGWATLISNEGQYRMTLDYDRITCWHDQVRAVSSGEIGTDTWVHVACTYDGTTLRAFVNGSSSGCTRLSQPISTLGTAGTMLVD